MSVCPSCGAEIPERSNFCDKCDASLGVVPAFKSVPSVRVPRPGQCFYHPNLPAVYVCNRCGRAVCRDDSKAYMDLVLCPQCYAGVVPVVAAPQPPAPAYAPAYAPPAPPPMPMPAAPPPMMAAPPVLLPSIQYTVETARQLLSQFWYQIPPDERGQVLRWILDASTAGAVWASRKLWEWVQKIKSERTLAMGTTSSTICLKCLNTLDDLPRFCTHCGKRLRE
jgi:hypothetical protein